MTEYRSRDITPALLEALGSMPVVVVTGMRQTGKTTLLQSQPELQGRLYASFDDFAHLQAAKADPDRFLDRDQPLTIDEAHKCPEIFEALKRAVDRQRRPGQFLLSGSANFAVLKRITESLAGRSVYLPLHPFNRREILCQTRSAPFIKTFFDQTELGPQDTGAPIRAAEIAIGGMPTVCLGQVKDPVIWFKGFEQTYLERDVRELSRVGDLMALHTLLRLAALRTGQLLSPSQLGRDAKLAAATTSRYLSLYEASFLIRRLHPYHGNRASRLIKSPKLYFSDAALAAYLAGLSDPATIHEDPLYGALFETYAAHNLLSIIDARWPQARLYFWAVQGRHEVDFVIEAGRDCMAVEVKAAARWHERDLAGLKAFLAATPRCRAAVLGYNGETAVNLGERLWAIPLDLMLA